MRPIAILAAALLILHAFTYKARADELSVRTAPPVVVKTVPQAGDTQVDPAVKEIRITFSKKMITTDYSVIGLSPESESAMVGKPRYLDDKKTCVLQVKLEPGKAYGFWFNTDKFRNFKDAKAVPAIPYLLVFETKKGPSKAADK